MFTRIKKTFQRSRDDKNGKSDRKCFRCGDPNHLIGECPKPPKDKNQRAFVGGSWSDSGEEDDEKVKDETCLVAHASSEVCSESSYFSDENSSIDDLALDNEYDKLCKMSLKIITKNKRLKATRNSLENELRELKDKLSTLEKNKGVDLDCAKCHALKIENEKLKEESTRLNKFEKSTHCLNEMLSSQKPSGDKLGLGFNSFEASSSGTKEIKFVKAQKKVSSDGGGRYEVRGTVHVSTRYCLGGGWTNRMVTRGTGVCQSESLSTDLKHNDKIKKAVWDCGTEKAPGPDGFTFGFFRHFWYLIHNDVYDAVSLVGSIYKIIAKILANRLVGVLDNIVNEVQSAFIADRQILDGPFILNEVIQWSVNE
ncbi:zf-CCHC domain-containing protein [Tanacetum coccineum]|uniref:Zf-CCHC domain-containing protein n=1 Tax=Tanacetum coccineum TaxID=301880 RepID=A0ABQ5E364_9ASTR